MLHLKTKHLLFALVPVGIAMSAIAWQTTPKTKSNSGYEAQDTIPSKKRHKTIREDTKEPNQKDIDTELRKLDEAMENLDARMEKIDWNKMEKEIEASVEKVNREMRHHDLDMEKMQNDIHESIKNIDFEKIKEETKLVMQQAEQNIDFKKMQQDIEHAIAEAKEHLYSDELNRSIEEASRVDMHQIKKELEKAKLEIETNKLNLKEQMSKAKADIKKATQEWNRWQQMLVEMEQDGLINTKEDYDIQYKGGELYINHQKQTQEVFNKYQDYFKNENTRIYKKNGGFKVNID
jgi:hypothetical protein